MKLLLWLLLLVIELLRGLQRRFDRSVKFIWFQTPVCVSGRVKNPPRIWNNLGSVAIEMWRVDASGESVRNAFRGGADARRREMKRTRERRMTKLYRNRRVVRIHWLIFVVAPVVAAAAVVAVVAVALLRWLETSLAT